MKAIVFAAAALIASVEAGEYLVSQLADQCVAAGSARCRTVSCDKKSADQFVYQSSSNQLTVYGEENKCLVVGSQRGKYIYATSCDNSAATQCTWQWQGEQLVNSYGKCMATKCNKRGKCYLVQAACAEQSAPNYETQCWDLTSNVEQYSYDSTPAPVQTYQESSSYGSHAPSYQQEETYGSYGSSGNSYGSHGNSYGSSGNSYGSHGDSYGSNGDSYESGNDYSANSGYEAPVSNY